ncbi:MAG: aminopeptidase P family protein [Cypionkella sp.]
MNDRIARVRAVLEERGLAGVIIPRFDPYQGEVVASHDERLAFLTGFSGSAGIALVTANRAVLFVDGRYQVQVKSEVDPATFEIAHFYDAPIERWLRDNAGSGDPFAINAGLVPSELFDKISAGLTSAGGRLLGLDEDLIDLVWSDQPPAPRGSITAFPLTVAGEASDDKRRRLGQSIAEQGADFLAETQPDNVAWLLNVRGSDVARTPLPHSTLLLDRDGKVDWFVDRRKLPNDLAGIEADGLVIRDIEDFIPTLESRAQGRTVMVDPGFAPVAARLAVQRGGGTPLLKISPITVAKAVKNLVELEGFRSVHVDDGVALTEFLAWLDAEVVDREAMGEPITELEAQAALLDFRSGGASFTDESFAPISASGQNAAMCHYSSKPSTNAAIGTALPYLIDSGGQYPGGTTDVTRTVVFGTMPQRIVAAYTAVVRGFIALASARFPATAYGHHLDALARRPLWDIGLDYDHGTGHGVGHFLSVHEHPHRFGKAVNNFRFEPGVIMTIEPGYYAEGDFGLRVENQVEVVAAGAGFLAFRSLTLAPIDLSFADLSQFSGAEIAWIDAYHRSVRAQLADRLSARGRAYLDRLTAPLHAVA